MYRMTIRACNGSVGMILVLIALNANAADSAECEYAKIKQQQAMEMAAECKGSDDFCENFRKASKAKHEAAVAAACSD